MSIIPAVSIDEIVTVSIYGKTVEARVFKIHPANTADVEVLETGKCYRITGLWVNSFHARTGR